MSVASLLILFALLIMFAFPDIPLSTRASVAAILAVTSFAIYFATSSPKSRRTVFNHAFGAILGGASGVIGGVASAYLLEGMDLTGEASRITLEAVYSGFFGVLLGMPIGVTEDRKRHVLVGAVSGFAGCTAAAALAAIYPGTTPGTIVLSALLAAPVGVVIGALTGLIFHSVHRLIIAAVPVFRDSEDTNR